MFGQIGYLIHESFRGWKSQRMVILPSLVTIFLCSLLLAGSFIALISAKRVLDSERSLYNIEAFLKDGISKDSLSKIQNRLEHFKHIERVEFISAEMAAEDFKKYFSEDMLNLVDENPLPASFRLTLDKKSANPADLINIKNALEKEPFIEETQAPISLVEKIAAWKFKLIFWPLCISILLLITLSLIISNSVRLSLLSRRLLVENMKYAGGSYRFIEFPFVLEGFMQGFLGSTLAVAVLTILVNALQEVLPFVSYFVSGIWGVFIAVVLLVCLQSAYFSYRTVRSFLLAKRNEQE